MRKGLPMRRGLLVAVSLFAAGCGSTPAPAPMTPLPTAATSNCAALSVVAPPARGGALVSGTTSTFVQGGTYVLPSGSLRLSGTGAGSVDLTAVQGSARSNAPFTFNFTGPGSMLFEPFQVAPQSVTMSLCNP